METVLGFLLPYGVIISSYVCILRRIRKTRFRRRIRSEKLILVIVVSFGLFWLPYHIINMVQVCVCHNLQIHLQNKTEYNKQGLKSIGELYTMGYDTRLLIWLAATHDQKA